MNAENNPHNSPYKVERRLPTWWVPIDSEDSDDATVVQRRHEFFDFGLPLDHWYSEIHDTHERFVTEPYHIGPKNMERVIAFCAQHKLNWFIDGRARHYHTCIRLVIVPTSSPDTLL
jgi:hypothetical protein